MKLYNENCLDILEEIPNGSVDLIMTDPPYASGGLFGGVRSKRPGDKYGKGHDFAGDTMDAYALYNFWRYSFGKFKDKVKPGGICEAFIDWRNLPIMIAALQAAGWIYRGLLVWNKTTARPYPGRYRQDAEFIPWFTNGPREKKGQTCPGVFTVKSIASVKRRHMTEKPLELIDDLLMLFPVGSLVFDPFMGSGTTGAACQNLGLNFIG